MQKAHDMLPMMQQIEFSPVIFHPTRRMIFEPLHLPSGSLTKMAKRRSLHRLRRNSPVSQISRQTCNFQVYLKGLRPTIIMFKAMLPVPSQNQSQKVTWSLSQRPATMLFLHHCHPSLQYSLQHEACSLGHHFQVTIHCHILILFISSQIIILITH